ncbi:hypothetical protein E2C01_089336 [Portunus trituberculatus]|uniref:Uncharacterized protein n=1 Tax=Portunus trituberculatus TaxID=210409 RepID=A0A5B7JBN1_PORTR|nr:hypothetical protein [Portunus trituberculatus]
MLRWHPRRFISCMTQIITRSNSSVFSIPRPAYQATKPFRPATPRPAPPLTRKGRWCRCVLV